MPTIVDTSVWALGLRRRWKDISSDERKLVFSLRKLIIDSEVVLLGVVRQEIPTGINDEKFYELSTYLRAFDDPSIAPEDYERAARFSNLCIAKGIAAPLPDMLICSIAGGRNWAIFTTDRDFNRYARHLPIQLLPLP